MNPAILALTLVAVSFTPLATAQELEAQDPVTEAHEAWNATQGGDWLLRRHVDLPTARYLYGLKAPALFTPNSDREFFELARMYVAEAEAMFAIDPDTLVADHVTDLRLRHIGTSDKVAVGFTQWVRGVPVVDGTVDLVFTPQGDLLGLDSRALPGVQDLDLLPAADPYAAVGRALAEFAKLEGVEAAFTGTPELVILGHAEGRYKRARLAWSVEVRNETEITDPHGRRMFIAAEPGMQLLAADQLIHHDQQVSGHVDSYATPGTAANQPSNPPTIQPMRFLQLTSPAGNVVTDANGDFTLNSANPVTVTAQYRGPWARVENQSGANYTISQSFTPGVPATLLMNPNPSEIPTSEASCFDSVVDLHEWLDSIDPGDPHLDFQMLTNANLNQTCNAYFNGSSINMFRAGGGCNNTGFSTVVVHEAGHWANVLYGSGNGSDGFGEGNADVWAMYVYDTPVVGEGFTTSGGIIRTGLNTRQFCGDSNPGCYGQVHRDGEVLMGALWKVRTNLNLTHGNTMGDLIADTLFVAWMNAYNDGQIRTFIEDHWLTLDDNNGNIYDGTPNFGDIDGGFRQQGFPGVTLQLIDIDHTPLADTLNEAGPYTVAADVTSLTTAVITGAELTWSVDGGPTSTVAMVNTGGDTWEASIPGQVSPAVVRYHLDAEDSAGNTLSAPATGDYSFVVGVREVLYFNDFDGATDEGWTHAQVATQDDWQRGTPQGKAEDPTGAYSGIRCWANDLGGSGWNGVYSANVHNYLSSPIIDCSGKTGVTLGFQRWLAVEDGVYDHAEILVNGNLVWSNPTGANFVDTAWQYMEVDISQWADNNPAVQVRFRMRSDAGLQMGGWNIDDFSLSTLAPVGQSSDVLALSGSQVGIPNLPGFWTITNLSPGDPWWLLASPNLNGLVFQGHAFDVGAPYQIVAQGTASPLGAATIQKTIPAGASGQTWYLEAASRTLGSIWLDSAPLTLVVQ